VCSFNIKFLGMYKNKENAALAAIVKDYDIVLVQELVASPTKGTYPDGKTYKADPEAGAFFEAMAPYFPAHVLSVEDTGKGTLHSSGSTTDWFTAFYKPNKVSLANDLPTGFIAEQRHGNPDFDRVPCAFGFRTPSGKLDFVLVSVHLHQGTGASKAQTRKNELQHIADWVATKDAVEKDFLVVGDMNIQSKQELEADLPQGYASLNSACAATNVAGSKPFDQVMYRPDYTADEVSGYTFKVRKLLSLLPPLADLCHDSLPVPLTHFAGFDYRFSDHNPVVFRLHASADDD
jgi:hypothetical protein